MAKRADRDKRRSRRRDAKSAGTEQRPWLPDKATVVEEKMFKSPSGRHYRILRTTETDPYDPPASKPRRKG
jgi:hypothetical protein